MPAKILCPGCNASEQGELVEAIYPCVLPRDLLAIRLTKERGGFYSAGDRDDTLNSSMLVKDRTANDPSAPWKNAWQGKTKQVLDMVTNQLAPGKRVIAVALAGGPGCDWERGQLFGKYSRLYRGMELKQIGDIGDFKQWLDREYPVDQTTFQNTFYVAPKTRRDLKLTSMSEGKFRGKSVYGKERKGDESGYLGDGKMMTLIFKCGKTDLTVKHGDWVELHLKDPMFPERTQMYLSVGRIVYFCKPGDDDGGKGAWQIHFAESDKDNVGLYQGQVVEFKNQHYPNDWLFAYDGQSNVGGTHQSKEKLNAGAREWQLDFQDQD